MIDSRRAAMASRGTVRVTILFATVLSLATLLPMQSIDRELKAAPGGNGIVEFELAFTPERITAILTGWGEELFVQTERSLVIDFGFIVGYSLFLWALVIALVRNKRERFQKIGILIASFPFIAGIFDVIENLLLLKILERWPATNSMTIFAASLCATIKFGLIAVVFALILISLFVRRKD